MKLSIGDCHRLAAAADAAERLGERPQTAWWLLTGAPGSGKTSLAQRFAAHGWPIVEDPGRAEFEASLRAGISPDAVRHDYLLFQHQVLQRALAAIRSTRPDHRTVFDYGVAEALAFMKLSGLPWEDLFLSAAARLHFERIFVLDLVPLSNTPGDAIRVESIDTRRQLRDLIEETYEALGYQTIRVPLLNPEARFQWIMDRSVEADI